MARVLTFTGGGTLRNWTGGAGLESQVSNDLVGLGYGITSVGLDNVQGNVRAILTGVLGYIIPTWNYVIRIAVQSPDNENPERVRNNFVSYLDRYFSDIDLRLTGDTAGNNPDIPKTLQEQWNGLVNSLPGAGTIASGSLLTMGLLAVAGIVILPIILNPRRR